MSGCTSSSSENGSTGSSFSMVFASPETVHRFLNANPSRHRDRLSEREKLIVNLEPKWSPVFNMQEEHHENLCSVKGIDSLQGISSCSHDSHLGAWVSTTMSTISPNKEIHNICYYFSSEDWHHLASKQPWCISVCLWMSQIDLLQISVTNHKWHETANIAQEAPMAEASISHDCGHVLQNGENTPWSLDNVIQWDIFP